MKNKKIFKRVFALIFSLLMCLSVLPFSVFASYEGKIDSAAPFYNVGFSITYDALYCRNANSCISTLTKSKIDFSSSDGVALLDCTDGDFYDHRHERGDARYWSVARMIYTPDISVSDIPWDNYYAELSISVDCNYTDLEIEGITDTDRSFLTPTLDISADCLTIQHITGFPAFGTLHGEALDAFRSGVFMYWQGDRYYNSYTIDDVSAIESLLAGSFECHVPFYDLVSVIGIDISLTIYNNSNEEPDTPEIPSSGGLFFNFADKASYLQLLNITRPSGVISSDYSVVDIYSSNNGGKGFRDITNNTKLTGFPLMQEQTSLFLIGGQNSDFPLTEEQTESSIGQHYKINLDYSLADCSFPDSVLKDGVLQTNCLGFRFEVCFTMQNGSIIGKYEEYKKYIASLNSYYYSFEPFSIKFGDALIPFDYFNFELNNDKNIMKVTLELDGKIDVERNFINAIRNNTSMEVTFTLDKELFLSGFASSFAYSGFYIKNSIDSTPIVPDSGSNGGFSQEDLDDMFNKGYLQGAADNADKNYVFGFVNGIWSGLNESYRILANGVSIGGISLGSIITSIVIIVCLAFVLKKVI